MTDTKIRLLLVDDQMIIRQGLRSLLEAKPDLEVVGEAENGQQAIDFLESCAIADNPQLPDVVLMDVRMPVMNGVAATRLICQHFTTTKVLVLTTLISHKPPCPPVRFCKCCVLRPDSSYHSRLALMNSAG